MPQQVTDLWNVIFFQPMLNGLVLLYGLLFQNFGLTVVVFTLLIRLIILPLTLRQLHAAKNMSRLQPELAKIQKRYANDRQKLSQEQMRLYKEHGVNPLGCAVPTLIQFPVWIGLYQSIQLALAAKPEDFMRLSEHLYNLPLVYDLVPLNSRFFWLDLALPDPFYLFPVLVGGSMWIQQKMATMPTTDERQQQMNATMQWMMPMMFGFFTVSFPSGLAIYWFASNLISIIVQYFVTGWGSMSTIPWLGPRLTGSAATAIAPSPDEEIDEAAPVASGAERRNRRRGNGKPRSNRQIGRRGR
jgi:YidC/Oxa1 family membrane protein insertase